ncbi:MAG: NGG1p interacting factor NIF3 [Epsilonproteobacteria bacterium]|nr:NGG1p interacting factor NIF3 [Campylobacterota bacterium]OIO16663.1 MAG: NGG1p interacting factor NIF3 [Helicobacteraceae bacterium CG1_02_36_14]PIP09825.1 MAG: NGG1p interacting factor NIF3 [Sulfurimonas sp. CG23_combo_of_CG06-09_8_20_14_all_36_33]PIS24040.1 MAG: NGG1p interacting factor NIF3 [Sulfurimonas sp. CG08_land_8_20_14_0_20_36_33]PIU35524.1 MAG: NGG1p interacting factor NIF3 [Sulfurimonas sp. CG07_land_8_20_14_0_80_36_56]PIV05445.1 MAG: NGG1p interacting factor NIF3 [Sulfurimonas
MYKLNYFVPTEAKEATKQALFEIGVGRYENYECCSFETQGTGQFKPIDNANPHLGELNKIEKVQEYKVEMICSDALIKKAIEVLKEVHPYEEVAFEVFRMEEF